MSKITNLYTPIPGGTYIETLTGNDGVVVSPTAGGNIDLLGAGNIYVTGTPNTETITLVGTTDHAVQIGNAGGSLTSIPVGADGFVLLGATGADPAFAALTSTDGSVTYTPGVNSLNLAVTIPGTSWSVITVNQTAVVNEGYFCNKASSLLLALPATSVIGDIIEVSNENTALGIQFTQAAGQQILFGSTNTTLGATGTLTSSAVGDTLKLVCYTANSIWRVVSSMGNWTIV